MYTLCEGLPISVLVWDMHPHNTAYTAHTIHKYFVSIRISPLLPVLQCASRTFFFDQCVRQVVARTELMLHAHFIHIG